MFKSLHLNRSLKIFLNSSSEIAFTVYIPGHGNTSFLSLPFHFLLLTWNGPPDPSEREFADADLAPRKQRQGA